MSFDTNAKPSSMDKHTWPPKSAHVPHAFKPVLTYPSRGAAVNECVGNVRSSHATAPKLGKAMNENP